MASAELHRAFSLSLSLRDGPKTWLCFQNGGRLMRADPSHTSPEGQQEVNHGTVVFF